MAIVKLGEQEWEFEYTNPEVREAMRLEDVFRGTYSEWVAALRSGSAKARVCLVYVLRKRTEPTLKFSDVTFPFMDLDLRATYDPDAEAGDEALEDDAAGEAGPTEPAAVVEGEPEPAADQQPTPQPATASSD